jgi:hypothetical protein
MENDMTKNLGALFQWRYETWCRAQDMIKVRRILAPREVDAEAAMLLRDSEATAFVLAGNY